MEAVERIAGSSRPSDLAQIHAQVKQHIDTHFPSLDPLLAQHGQPSEAGPGHSLKRIDSRRSGKEKQKRTLEDEIAHWTAMEAAADAELQDTSSTLPGLLSDAQERLQTLLESAQSLSLERYALADKLANLVAELDSSAEINGTQHAESSGRRKSVLEQMEVMSAELSRLEAGLAWVSVLEQVVLLSEQVLSPGSHRPSPLAALPSYQTLHQLVEQMQGLLPGDMSLLRVITEARDVAWRALKDIMSQELLRACASLKWPLKVGYGSVPPHDRRAFERAYQDLLILQAEGEALGISIGEPNHWSSGSGLYPLQAMVQPISLRFKYHFQGSRNTNRIDKPEWAFSNILDQIYEHQAFLEEYLQPLTGRAGFGGIDVKSEFIMLLFPILLNILRARIPKLLDHPALLAHTLYQTVLFDESVREGGFDIDAVSLMEDTKSASWEGLAGVLLRDEGWFSQWLAGEKKFADTQLNDVISSSDAWIISDEVSEDENGMVEAGLKPTTSARQVKALIEQITDRYAPLPSLEYRLPFLTTIQLPILATYYSRISGSLDAFETLSSAFVRAVPGALSGNTRGGVHIEPARLTGGSTGLDRLAKAYLSASWLLNALRVWADDVFFIEMSTELKDSIQLRWKLHDDVYLPAEFKSAASVSHTGASVFDTVIERYNALQQRAEDMVVRHVTAEVQNDLKEHLKRRWDQASLPDEPMPDSSLINALSTYSSHLSILRNTLPHLIVSRLYRRTVVQLSNHIFQRALYSGWSKFTSVGGQEFLNEVKDWVQTSTSVLQPEHADAMDIDLLGPDAISLPWASLLDAGKLLSLLGENDKGLPTFSQSMAAAWSDGDESRVLFCQRAGVESMDAGEMQGILRRRLDCWR